MEPIVNNGAVKSQENNTNIYYDTEDDVKQPLLRKKTPSINNS